MAKQSVRIISSLIWKMLETSVIQMVQFAVQLLLARILMPEDYGLISLVAIFIAISNVLIQSGFSTALIQRLHIDDIDISTVLYASVTISFFLYGVIWMISPAIGSFFKEARLAAVIRVLALLLPMSAVNSVYQALVSRKLQFRAQFIAGFIASLGAGAISITMAMGGYGVWALVVQQLLYQLLRMIGMIWQIPWRPKWVFSWPRAMDLLGYGWKILGVDLIDRIYMNSRSFVIAKLFQPAMLGFYNRGKEFPSLLVTNINGSIQSILFPVLSSHQQDPKQVKQLVQRAIVTSSFLVFPMMVGLAVIARPLVAFLLTEKWLPAVPFLQIYCISYALWPINTANLQAINALGRSDISLKLEVAKKLGGLVILLLSIPFGIHVIALGTLVSGIISMFLNMKPNRKLLDYRYRDQFMDILPSLLLSLTMGGVVIGISLLELPSLFVMALQIASGIAFYFTMAYAWKLDCFMYLLALVNMFACYMKERRQKEDPVYGTRSKVSVH